MASSKPRGLFDCRFSKGRMMHHSARVASRTDMEQSRMDETTNDERVALHCVFGNVIHVANRKRLYKSAI